MYSTAATKPARSSCCACRARSGRRPARSPAGAPCRAAGSRAARAGRSHPHVRPEELVRRAEEHVDVPAGDVDRAVRPVVDGVRPGERAGAVRELTTRATSGVVPTVFDAIGKATTLVRSESSDSRSSRSSERSSCTPAKRTTTPRSSASSSHGATLASWSSPVQTISSPRSSVRPSARVSRKLSEVMFGPKATSSGCARRRSGRRPRARARLARRCACSSRKARPGSRCPRAGSAHGVDHLVRALRAAGPVEEREPAVERGVAGADASASSRVVLKEAPLRSQSSDTAAWPSGRADEAVTLCLRDELACRLRLRFESHVDVDLDVHECVPAVGVALRHLTARLRAPVHSDLPRRA